eukprot:TRINITY_DN2134_c0_g1_i1.p1 TRINITY_DN2134_c0_g1~~TRINITY_DN2134_c0_g1_i1.p1  ORF type:complete len:367 (-),score=26.30 TRINITY_DN2134_c0_g1_i1:186-1205(-)
MEAKDIVPSTIPSKPMQKRRFLPTASNILKKIFDYLTFHELHYPLRVVCKEFKLIVSEDTYYTRRFLREINLDEAYAFETFVELCPKERNTIVQKLMSKEKDTVLPMVSVFSDGGAYSSDYSIDRIFSPNDNLYSTHRDRGENVHILCVCSDYLKVSKFQSLIQSIPEAKHQLKVNYEASLELHEKFYKSFGVMKHIKISMEGFYTCYMNSFAIFVSMYPIPIDSPCIKQFDGIKTVTQAKKLGLKVQNEESMEERTFLEFTVEKAGVNGVSPLLFGELGTDYIPIDNVKILQKVAFKYLLLKLIDSNKNSGDHNIDCYHFILEGNYVKYGYKGLLQLL